MKSNSWTFFSIGVIVLLCFLIAYVVSACRARRYLLGLWSREHDGTTQTLVWAERKLLLISYDGSDYQENEFPLAKRQTTPPAEFTNFSLDTARGSMSFQFNGVDYMLYRDNEATAELLN
jgi:hypothetical protein